jgi:hypothetical protein
LSWWWWWCCYYLEEWERNNIRSSSNQDVLGLDGADASVGSSDLDLVSRLDAANTRSMRDLVLLEQTSNALGQTSDGLVFGLHHGWEINLDAIDCTSKA